VSLFVDVIGHGYPVLLIHGGPSLDHWSLSPFRQCAGQFTLTFYDHRCNGRSTGAPVSSMTWENLTADANALREELGFERWAVLGYSFGGHVALEYALRYPACLSHLVLLDTGGEARWAQQNAAEVLARRGYSPKKMELARRWFNGEFTPHEHVPMAMRIGPAYYHHPSLWLMAREEIQGGWRTKYRPQALISPAATTLRNAHRRPGSCPASADNGAWTGPARIVRAGDPAIAAADPLPDDLRHAPETITRRGPGARDCRARPEPAGGTGLSRHHAVFLDQEPRPITHRHLVAPDDDAGGRRHVLNLPLRVLVAAIAPRVRGRARGSRAAKCPSPA
jgi:pimeloyl-ACP methyl ester carboxylesterase